ncbi:fibronectin type III domain-containing protein [Patescibacteria group bacterium]|nr:fibronectin type III domain-containing protein [Patescibacteria group bacterium]
MIKIFIKNKLIAGLFIIILLPVISFNTANATITSVTTETVSISHDNVYLRGIVNSETHNANTNVWFEYGTEESLSNYTATQSINILLTFLQQPFDKNLTGLSPNTTYYYRAVVQNTFNRIERGNILEFTTLDIQDLEYDNYYPYYDNTSNDYSPTAITSSASSINNNSATLNATVNPNNSYTDYWFEYGTTESLGFTTINKNLGEFNYKLTTNTYIDSLASNTRYYYRVVAKNIYGSSYGNIFNFKTIQNENISVDKKQPTAITTTALFVNQCSALLNGNIIPNNDLTTAWFEWSEDPNFINNVRKNADHTIGSQSGEVYFAYSLANLTIDKTYYFRTVAKNSYGISYGDIHNFTTRIPSQNTSDTETPPVFVQSVSADGILTIGAEFNKSKSRPGKEVIYTVNYKNNIDSVLENAVLKINLPNEVEYKNSSFANVDLENNIASFDIGNIVANDSGSVSIKFQITELANVEVLKFNSSITYLNNGNRGNENLASELELNSSLLTASAFNMLGNIFDNPFISLLFGISIGLGIYHFVIKKNQIVYEDDPLK